MIGGSDVFWGGVAPGIAAAVALAIVWRLTGKAASAWRTALVVGYVAGHWALDARTLSLAATLNKSFQPTEARDWLPLLMLLAIAPDALACVGKFGPALGWMLRIALCAFIPWRLLHGSTYLPLSIESAFGFDTAGFDTADFDLGGWSTGEAVAWIGGIGVAILLVWQLSRRVDQRSGVLVRSALAVFVGLAGAIAAALSGSLISGQMFGVLTASLAGCGLASALLSAGRGPEAAAGPVATAFGCLVMIAHFYAELKFHNAALLLVAVALAIGWLPFLAKLSPRWQAVCRCLVCFAALGAAVTMAGIDFAETQAETESNPYQNFQP